MSLYYTGSNSKEDAELKRDKILFDVFDVIIFFMDEYSTV